MIYKPALGYVLVTVAFASAAVAGGLTPKPAVKAKTVAAAKPTVTFTHDIAPIVYQNCTSCHRDGEVAPFSLSNYSEVKRHAATMAAVTQNRFMPPWKAAPDDDKFIGERRLTNTQIATIQKWVDEGMPEGKASDLPPKPSFPSGWRLGKPDEILQPEESYPIAADGADVYRCFVIPTNYADDRFLSGLEVHPGNGQVVHHIIVYLDTSGAARKRDAEDPGLGYTSFGGPGFRPSGALGGWAPGNDPLMVPDGDGILLPKGADIVMQVHYHKNGKAESDLSKIGLYFTKKPVDKRVRTFMIIQPFLNIQPGDKNYQAQTTMVVPENVHLLDVLPHMHLVGHDITVSATPPTGDKETLVTVPNWDFNWQTRYSFREPVAIPKESKISVVAHYDNTADNPRNPNSPPKAVKWGEQTTDEMCVAFLSYTVDSEHLLTGMGDAKDPKGTIRDAVVTAMLSQFDGDGDGRLDPQELAKLITFFRSHNMSRQAGQGGIVASASPDTLAEKAIAFQDKDGDGKLNVEELKSLLKILGTAIPEAE